MPKDYIWPHQQIMVPQIIAPRAAFSTSSPQNDTISTNNSDLDKNMVWYPTVTNHIVCEETGKRLGIQHLLKNKKQE